MRGPPLNLNPTARLLSVDLRLRVLADGIGLEPDRDGSVPHDNPL